MKGATSIRLPSLTLWIGGRLATRQAITWVTKAFKGEKGLSSQDLTSLLRGLADQATRQSGLSVEISKIWQLLYFASRDRESGLSWHLVEQFTRVIRQGNSGPEDVKTLIAYARPRLEPSEPSNFVNVENEFSNDPRQWVIWEFRAASGSVDHSIQKISRDLLSTLPTELLAQIITESTHALVQALDLAQKAGWIRNGYDFANSSVARVAFDLRRGPSSVVEEDEDDQQSRDPDAYHDSFAPLLRLMTSVFDVLVEKNLDAARRAATLWEERREALFIRLQAHAGLQSLVWDGSQVGKFLLLLSNLPFWRWGAFPEIASLRALRWRDMPVQVREQIANRLITGPPRDDFDPDREISEETLSYWRDHEIARVADNNQDVPGPFLDLIRDRRASDTDFPDDVPAVETGASGLRFQGVPDGDPKAFSNVSDANLIAALANATRDRPFGEGNNAEAYARKNRRRLVDLLAQRKNTDEDTATVWELALSYPHDKPDDVEDARPTAERIAKRALEMHDELFERVLDQLCYWLDATDELLKDFSGAALLWERLLPVSARRENTQIMSDAANEADLSSAALNVPLGHLISFFL